MGLVDDLLRRDIRAGARLLRWIDDGLPEVRPILKQLYPHTGKAYLVGVTGSPGAGKSTLVDRLIRSFRDKGKTVAVAAIDPSSPFSGGAILGDRIRMQDHALDEGVFIRSFATRGHLGGLTSTTSDVAHALDAMGWDVVFIETVGVGQDEVEIQNLAHTTLVVMAPGLGDEIQAIKAGILEIADVFVVNKADRDGADRTVRELKMMLDLGAPQIECQRAGEEARSQAIFSVQHQRLGPAGWVPKIVKTVALNGDGMEDLVSAMDEHHRCFLDACQNKDFMRARFRQEFLEVFRRTLLSRGWSYLMHEEHLGQVLDRLLERSADPYTLAEQAVEAVGRFC
jgi:LAO/AO transport system kinase